MRYFYLFFCSLLAFTLYSQTPPFINYQGVARHASGDPLVNKTIGLKFDIRQGSGSGTIVFTESQSVQTGNFGVFSVRIGTTTPQGVTGVNWGSGTYFLQVSIDTSDTQNYTVLGVQQIISVPYAMHAASVPASFTNNVLSVGTQTMAINDQSLSLSAPNTLSITNGNTVEIAPTLSVANNVLTVGPATNTVSLPISPATTVTGGGAAVVTNTGSVYQVTVAPATITPSTNVSVTGAYPDFTVSATPSLSLLGPNTLSISGGNTVGLAPTLALNVNTLSVGPTSNSITIPTPTVTGTGAASINPPVGLNYVIHVPLTTLTPSGGGISILNSGVNQFTLTVNSPTLANGSNVNVTGTHPNFVINATPTLSLLSANTLSISYGNSVPLAPSLAYTNNVLTVGPSTNTVNIPVGNTYTVAGPGLQMNGTAPNYTIALTAPVLGVTGQSISITQGTASNAIGVPSPTLGLTNNTLQVGANSIALQTYTVAGPGLSMTPGPNHTITATQSNPTITSGGIVSVTPSGNTFTVSVPGPVLGASGQSISISQGTANSSVAVPSPTLGLTNNTLQVGANSIALQTYTVAGPGLSITPGPNHTITAIQSNPTITAGGIASVTPLGNTFTVSVPGPVLGASGQSISISQGTANSSVVVPSPTLGLTNNTLQVGTSSIALQTYTVAGPGITMSGGPNHTITTSMVSPTFVSVGAVSVTPQSGSTITVTVPETSVSATTGIASVNPVGTNSFNISVPAPSVIVSGNVVTVTQGSATTSASLPTPSYNPSNGVLTTGTATTNITPTLQITGNVLTVGPAGNTIPLPPSSSTIQQSGIAQVSPSSGNNFTVHVPPPVYNPATGELSQGTATQNITQAVTFSNNVLTAGPATNSVSIPNANISGTGAATVTSSTNNYTVNVPIQTFSASTGILAAGPHTLNITPATSFTNNILTVGPSSNSVNISSVSPWTQSATAVVLTTPASNVGIGSATPTEKLQIESTIGPAAASILAPLGQSSSLFFGTNSTHNLGRVTYDIPTNSMQFFTNSTARLHIDGNGNLGVKTNVIAPYDMAIFNPGSATSIRLFNSTTVGAGFVIGHNNFGASILNYDNTPMQLATNGAARLTIAAGGNVGIGTTAPAELLTVESPTSSAQVSIVSPSPQLSVLNFGYQGNHTLGKIQYNSTSNMMAFGTSGTNGHMVIDGIGRVGIGTTSPQENLTVENTSSGAQIAVLSPSPQAGSIFFGHPGAHALGAVRYDNSSNSMDFWTGNTPQMRIASNGNVGIKTIPGAFDLSVYNSGNITSIQLENSNSINQGLVLSQSSLEAKLVTFETTPLHLATSGVNRLTVAANGNVGVGTISPAELFQVEAQGGGAQLSVISPATSISSINFGKSTNHFTGQIQYNNSSDMMGFGTGNTPSRMVIDANGRVGIGTSSPSHQLTVAHSSNSAQIRITSASASNLGLVLDQNASATNLLSYETTPLNFGTSGATRMTISSTGNVGINTTSPSARLEVTGNVRINDGSQGPGEVLTSDALGNASWQPAFPPTGAIMAFAGPTTNIPSGWALCNGAQVSRTGATANLFAVIGTAWGIGNNSTTFNLPDMRGMFLRGVDDTPGTGVPVDPDRNSRTGTNGAPGGVAVGSVQQDQLESHSHTSSTAPVLLAGIGGSPVLDGPGTGSSVSSNGGNETRPKNVYVYYIIKL